MLKRLLRSKKGTAEIVGTALFLVILFFFFSNVFLFHNRVSREMDQVVADKVNSPVLLETTTGSGNLTVCAGNPTFGGFGSLQRPGAHTNPEGPPYGKIVSGSYASTYQQDNASQVLNETGKTVTDDWNGKGSTPINDDYICLNATYNFTMANIHNVGNLRLVGGIAFSFYGYASDAEGEAVDVNLYNFKKGVFEGTGLKIRSALEWYNVTMQNSANYVSLPSGNVTVNYLSDSNGYYYDEITFLILQIDFQGVSADPLALSVSDLGGRDLSVERLWIAEGNNDNHSYIDLSTVPNPAGTPVEIWIAAGSSINILFGNTLSYDNKTLTITYQPSPGKITFKILTNTGNIGTTTYNFPS